MRLLLEGRPFEVVGGLVVAGFALVISWIPLEAVLGAPGFLACLLSVAAGAGALELMSRRHYGLPAWPGGRLFDDRPLRLVRSGEGQRRRASA